MTTPELLRSFPSPLLSSQDINDAAHVIAVDRLTGLSYLRRQSYAMWLAASQAGWDSASPTLPILCLGDVYSYPWADRNIQLPPTMAEALALYGFPPDIQAMLSLPLPARRIEYVNKLWTGSLRATAERARRLQAELFLWQRMDRQVMYYSVDQHLDMAGQQRTPDAHWLWLKGGRKDTGLARPVVTYQGWTNVPVYKLLWALERPMDLLSSRDRPVKTNECPDIGEGKLCVNPHHFRRAEISQPARNGRVRRGYKDAFSYKPLLKNCASEYVAGREQVICPGCKMPLSPGSQANWLAGKMHMQGHCGRCYKRYLERYGRVVQTRHNATRVERDPSDYQHEVHIEWDKIMLEQERERNRLPMPDDSGEVLDTD